MYTLIIAKQHAGDKVMNTTQSQYVVKMSLFSGIWEIHSEHKTKIAAENEKRELEEFLNRRLYKTASVIIETLNAQ